MIRKFALACWTSLVIWMPASAESVRLVTGDDFPPYTGKNLPHYGMLSEVVLRAFSLAGMQATLDWVPWKRGYELTKIGEFDATFPYLKKPDREKDYLYSEPLYASARAVYARPGNHIDPARIDSFRGLTYCAPLGFIIQAEMEALLKDGGLRIERPPSLVSCARMLAAGRVDYFITDIMTGDELLKQENLGPEVIRLARPIEQGAFYLIVPRRRPSADALIARFNSGLNSLKLSGEYTRILRQHLHKLPQVK